MSASINIVDNMKALQRRNTAKVREYSRRSRQECCFNVFDFDLLCVDQRMIAGVISYLVCVIGESKWPLCAPMNAIIFY